MDIRCGERLHVSPARNGASTRLTFASVLASMPFVVAGCSFSPLPLGATEQAKELHGMWILFFWSGLGVAALVTGLIVWCVLRYRQKRGDDTFPPQFRRNNVMEVVYTIIPIAMVCGLFAISYPAERHVETIAGNESVVVDVTGFRWSWRFDYPGRGVSVTADAHGPPEFVLPLGETARFNVTSADVDHSFWVPAFLFKRDAIPGLRNVFDWTPNKLGTYRGECGEYCGLDHTSMTFSLRIVTPAEFTRWVADRRRLALTSPGASR